MPTLGTELQVDALQAGSVTPIPEGKCHCQSCRLQGKQNAEGTDTREEAPQAAQVSVPDEDEGLEEGRGAGAGVCEEISREEKER